MGRSICKKKPTAKAVITCNCAGCTFKSTDNSKMNRHINTHLTKLKQLSEALKETRCPWVNCLFTSQSFNELERHMYFHGYHAGLVAQGRLECKKNLEIPQCYLPVKTEIIPDLKQDFCCEWSNCERKFSSISDFQDHVQDHANFDHEVQKTPENERPKESWCKWGFCKRKFDNKYRLVEHIRKHTNKKDIACFQCGEIFRTKTTLFDHLRRQPENNTQSYQCAQCFKFFSTEKLLRNHVVQHVNYFKCSLCDMTCSNLSALTTHVRYRHLNDRPFKCTECDMRFVRKCDLVAHGKRVHIKEVFRCDQAGCYYVVRSYNLLRRHYLQVHGNSPFIYLCHCCDKSFKSAKNLSGHLIKKHDFQLPSGHKRFTYRVDKNGFYRLETMRIESLEVTKQFNHSTRHFESTDATQDSSCYEIVSIPNEERVLVSNNAIEAHLVGEVVISLPEMRKIDENLK